MSGPEKVWDDCTEIRHREALDKLKMLPLFRSLMKVYNIMSQTNCCTDAESLWNINKLENIDKGCK